MSAMFTSNDHTFAVCAYGDSPFLQDCLISLKNQTVSTNVIICTTTPNAHITSLSQEFGFPLFVSDGVPSISSDWNRALSHVKTPLATIAHQDDIYLPDYANSVIQYANQSNEPLIIFTDYGEIRSEGFDDDMSILKVKRLLLFSLKNPSNWPSIKARRRALSFGCSICCPSVTFNLEVLNRPIFDSSFKCDLDWQTWERISRLDGSFVYCDKLLMRHRIHNESETTALIEDNTRSKEDYEMLCKFWPKPIAYLINKLYRLSQRSNS